MRTQKKRNAKDQIGIGLEALCHFALISVLYIRAEGNPDCLYFMDIAKISQQDMIEHRYEILDQQIGEKLEDENCNICQSE